MKERLIAEILTCIKKAMIIALIGMLFPISSPILFIVLGLWIYIPIEKEIEDKKRKKKDK